MDYNENIRVLCNVCETESLPGDTRLLWETVGVVAPTLGTRSTAPARPRWTPAARHCAQVGASLLYWHLLP